MRYDKKPTKYGVAIRMVRQATGITAERLAAAAGYTRVYVNQLESGVNPMNERCFAHLCDSALTLRPDLPRDRFLDAVDSCALELAGGHLSVAQKLLEAPATLAGDLLASVMIARKAENRDPWDGTPRQAVSHPV